MDSGNSGSFQSSSGEDDEFDSQTDGFSALSNHQQPPPPPPPETSSSYMYHNPLSNYFDLVSEPQPPPPSLQPLHIQNHNHPKNTLLINNDVDWSKNLRSPTNQTLFGSNIQLVENTTTDAATLLSTPPPPAPTTTTTTTTGKNLRKRSRTSRRAPTTVMTTDASNFRAMVQEFTGIPASPFTSTTSSSAPFLRNRFNLLGGRASHSPFNRPFSQNLQSGSSSFIDHANNNPNPLLPPCFNVPDNQIVSNTSGYSSFKISHQESRDISPNDSHMIHMGGGLDEYSYVNTNMHSQVPNPNQIYSQDRQTTKRVGNNIQDDVSWQMINKGVNSDQDHYQSHINFPS